MRKAVWRSECGNKTERAQNAALESSIFILTEFGPTCFGVREDGNRINIQVRIGDPHSCTCPDFKKTSSELCKHICWVLLKKFRVPKEDPLSWQLGLVESEVDSLLRGYEQRTRRHLPPIPSKKPNGDANTSDDDGCVAQRKLEPEDICPVCQEDFFTKNRKPVTFCRYGCGNSVHMHCMKLWAEHQQTGESGIRKQIKDGPIACPICRGKFCLAATLRLEILAAREYLNFRSNTLLLADKPDVQLNPSSLNKDDGSLPHLISIQSVASLFGNANNATGNVQNALVSQHHGFHVSLAVSNLASNQQQLGAPEAAKDIRISFKKPKPGMQCFQCLSLFKKGTIVWQLPCRHLIHKTCLNDKDLTCVICHNPFSLPRTAVASAPTNSSPKSKSQTLLRQTLMKNSDSMPGIVSEQQHYAANLSIGQMIQQIKPSTSNANNSRLAKARLAAHVKNIRSATVNGENEVLPSSFCLVATQVGRLGGP